MVDALARHHRRPLGAIQNTRLLQHRDHHGEEEQPGGDRPQASYGRVGSFPPLASPHHCAIVHDGDDTSRSASEALTVASGGLGGVSGQVADVYAELAALTRDVPRFRGPPRATWNPSPSQCLPDCSAVAAWPGVGDQVEHRTG